MTWEEAWKVGAVVIASLGGGGAIVFGLSGFLGKVWVDRLKGEIDARLARLDAALKHKNFVRQRHAELEFEATTECWRAAQACVPALNSVRPINSGTSEELLAQRTEDLANAHNNLLAVFGRHQLFLDWNVVTILSQIRATVSLELSNVRHHKHFDFVWWENGEKNQGSLAALVEQLRTSMTGRIAELVNAADGELR